MAKRFCFAVGLPEGRTCENGNQWVRKGVVAETEAEALEIAKKLFPYVKVHADRWQPTFAPLQSNPEIQDCLIPVLEAFASVTNTREYAISWLKRMAYELEEQIIEERLERERHRIEREVRGK